jgi:hypothetical protein
MIAEKIKAEIKTVKNVIEQNLDIPHYQRPYCWDENNVRLLLQDISDSWRSNKKTYRIGSVILYKEEGSDQLCIVDGQQRITTILLILKILKSNIEKSLCESLKYEHINSKNNIIKNYEFIQQWINENIKEKNSDFLKYLTEYCEFVEIVVTDLSEAFQMFDSQNGRGKELETYNLLKAYHIRAMECIEQETKIKCDKRWEDATRYKQNPNNEKENIKDVLKQIFDEQLYRTRIWSRKEEAYEFNKKHITEFKGTTFDKCLDSKYPFQNKLLLQFFATNFLNSVGADVKGIKTRFKNGDLDNINPFVLITQDIVNGESFFDYIETYVQIYKQLFIDLESAPLKEFKGFFKEYCQDYAGANRTGDKYLKELYKSLIFITFDKFGEDGVNKYYYTLYSLVYRLRLESKQVRYNSVAKYPLPFFVIIEQAKSDLDLQELEKKEQEKFDCTYENAESVKNWFFDRKRIN